MSDWLEKPVGFEKGWADRDVPAELNLRTFGVSSESSIAKGFGFIKPGCIIHKWLVAYLISKT